MAHLNPVTMHIPVIPHILEQYGQEKAYNQWIFMLFTFMKIRKTRLHDSVEVDKL